MFNSSKKLHLQLFRGLDSFLCALNGILNGFALLFVYAWVAVSFRSELWIGCFTGCTASVEQCACYRIADLNICDFFWIKKWIRTFRAGNRFLSKGNARYGVSIRYGDLLQASSLVWHKTSLDKMCSSASYASWLFSVSFFISAGHGKARFFALSALFIQATAVTGSLTFGSVQFIIAVDSLDSVSAA